jgi:hypothetical protein
MGVPGVDFKVFLELGFYVRVAIQCFKVLVVKNGEWRRYPSGSPQVFFLTRRHKVYPIG